MFESDAAGGGEDAMIYSEWLEGICAIALYKMSSPFMSLSKRYGAPLLELYHTGHTSHSPQPSQH